MGHIGIANDIVQNTTDILDKILQSKSTVSISGLGEPILVTWYNMNDSLSTADNGTETVDAIMGKDSPFRYNKIENLPIYGITKDLQNLEMALDDNGIMDLNVEIEPVLLPNTIIPGPFDYMEYNFSNGRNVFFRANDVKIMTAKSNGFYKVPMHLVDMDSKDYPNGIKELTVKEFKVRLDNVGTNDKCIVSNKVFDDILALEKLISEVISDYVDTFFVRRYNSFILRGFKHRFTIYDPYLVHFIIKHSLLDHYDEIIQPIIIGQEENFRATYNKTFLRALELKDISKIKQVQYHIDVFNKSYTNPFDYYGEEQVNPLQVYEDIAIQSDENNYMGYDFLYTIPISDESTSLTIMENIVIRYFKRDDLSKFLSINEINELKSVLEIEYGDYYFHMIPIVVYILIQYVKYLNNSYQ